jgi:hypothetical protein
MGVCLNLNHNFVMSIERWKWFCPTWSVVSWALVKVVKNKCAITHNSDVSTEYYVKCSLLFNIVVPV